MIGPVVRALLGHTLHWGKWILLLIVLAYTVIGVGVASSVTLEKATSVWSTSIWPLQSVAFVGGILLGLRVPVLVAHGITRHKAAVGGVLAVLALAFGVAAMVQVGMAVEWMIYRLYGMPYQVDDGHVFGAAGQAHLVLAEYGLFLASHLVSGLLTFLVCYRFGRRGVFAIPLALVPVLAAGTALHPGPGVAMIGSTLALTLALVAVVAGLLATVALTRTIPIRSK